MKKRDCSWLWFIISLAIMLIFRLLPVPSGLTASGMQVLGILVGAIILWLTLGTTWTSAFVLFALCTVDSLTVASVYSNSFGNTTVVLMVFCYMLAACLVTSGVARRIAIWFLTNKIARKSPWGCVAMFLAAVFVLISLLPSSAGILVTLPILDEMLLEVGCQKNKATALTCFMALGCVVMGVIANGANPIAHAVTIQGMGYYTEYTGGSIDFFQMVAVLEPVVIVCAIVYFLIGRLLWKPDVTPLANLDYDRLAASVGPMTKKAKWSAWVYAMVVIMWVLPGVCKYVAPGAYVYLSKIDQTYPPIIALVLMTLVKVDGEKVLDFKDAMANASWGVFLFIASVMAMGSAMANSEIGISAWLAAEMGPLFSNISPEMFIAIAVVFLVVLTNFTSNSVVVALGFTIFMPLCTTVYADSIGAAFMGLMIINASQHSWATPPATPASAIAAGSGWLDTGNMFRWGMVVAAFSCVILLTLGQLLGKVFC